MIGMRIMAGVVTYNPNIQRFEECIKKISAQVETILVYDNGSNNIESIEELLRKNQNTVLLKNDSNLGIATALAQIMKFADNNDFEWVLSMDQDSLLQSGLIDVYKKAIERHSDLGMLTCLIQDRNFSDPKYETQDSQEVDVEFCITSGALTNVEAYKKTSGYDEDFFIDCVDFDICFSLREAGYRILRVNYKGLLHEVGHGENRKFLGKKIVVYHEKAQRIYFISRNTIWLYKKHSTYVLLRMVKKELALVVKIALYEDNKIDKWKAFLEGVKDAGTYNRKTDT